jgi:hypothetical protein
MLSRTSTDDGSGRRSASISLSSLSPRWLVIGALTVVVPVVVALAVTEMYGPLFGIWGWAEVALILLLAETLVLLAFGMYRGEHNPYRSVLPGAGWGVSTNDPQVLYAGTLRPPVARDARVSSNATPLLLAIAPALGALAMLGVVIAGSSDNASAGPQPEPLPIVAVDGSISMMLESVEVTSDRLVLAIRIDDLEWGRSSSGYMTPQPEDVTVDGRSIDEAALPSAGFTSIFRTGKPDVSQITAWQLQLPMARPADLTAPMTVTVNTLRFAPNRQIPDLPETIDGDWSFTFIPAEA